MTFAGIDEDNDEDAKVATILEVLGALDKEVVRRFLRQHNGNAENALNVSPFSLSLLYTVVLGYALGGTSGLRLFLGSPQ